MKRSIRLGYVPQLVDIRPFLFAACEFASRFSALASQLVTSRQTPLGAGAGERVGLLFQSRPVSKLGLTAASFQEVSERVFTHALGRRVPRGQLGGRCFVLRHLFGRAIVDRARR